MEINPRIRFAVIWRQASTSITWLLDIRLDSHSFRADRASIVLEELGLQTHNRSFETWMSNGGDTALRSYGTTDDLNCIPQKHIDFFQGLLRGHETEDYFFFHANYAPNWRLEDHDSNTALWMSLNDTPSPHYSGKIAVLGHTPQPEGKILDLGHLICIDTGCGFGGLLTALDLTSRKIWQVDELGQEITAENIPPIRCKFGTR